jgi:hypothetical protein
MKGGTMELEERFCGHCGHEFAKREPVPISPLERYQEVEARMKIYADASEVARIKCEELAKSLMAGPMMDRIRAELRSMEERISQLELAVKMKTIRTDPRPYRMKE